MHRRPTPQEIKPLDPDHSGYNARETFHPAPGHPLVFPNGRTVAFTRPMGVLDHSPARMEREDAQSLRQSLGSGGMRYNYSDEALAKATDRANRPASDFALDDVLLGVGLALASIALILVVVGVLNS